MSTVLKVEKISKIVDNQMFLLPLWKQEINQNTTTKEEQIETHAFNDNVIGQGTTSTIIQLPNDLRSNTIYEVSMFVKLKYGKYF